METETNVKEPVYTKAELASMTSLPLKEILDRRKYSYHPATGEIKLREYVLKSNPSVTDTGSAGQGGAPSLEGDQNNNSGPTVDTRSEKERIEAFKNSMAKTEKLADKIYPTTGIVSIELVDKKRSGTIIVRDYTDETGSLRELKDQYGKKVIRTLGHNGKGVKLDLDNKNDKLFYEHVKDHPIYVLGSDPCLRIVNTEADAKRNVDRAELAIDAKLIIKQQDDDMIRDLARLLNVSFTDRTTAAVIKHQLYELAENDPDKLLEVWNHPDREIRILVHRGMSKGIITKVNGVFRVGDTTLGTNFDESVYWFKSNEDLIPSFRAKIYA